MKTWRSEVKRREERATVIPACPAFWSQHVCYRVDECMRVCVSKCVLCPLHVVCGLFIYVCRGVFVSFPMYNKYWLSSQCCSPAPLQFEGRQSHLSIMSASVCLLKSHCCSCMRCRLSTAVVVCCLLLHVAISLDGNVTWDVWKVWLWLVLCISISKPFFCFVFHLFFYFTKVLKTRMTDSWAGPTPQRWKRHLWRENRTLGATCATQTYSDLLICVQSVLFT